MRDKRNKMSRQNKKAIKIYKDYYVQCKVNLLEILQYFQDHNKKVGIWGAGLKGKAFLSVIDPYSEFITCVYDVNEKIYGSILSTGHKVVDYRRSEYQEIQVVLLMNNIYETEVAGLLKSVNMNAFLLNVDSVIDGKLGIDDVLGLRSISNELPIRDMKDKVAASVTIYNCDESVISNIDSYYNEVGTVFVFDNSTNKSDAIIQYCNSKEKIVYVDGNGNKGLSVAFNQCAKLAMDRGYEWLLTFDQDSYIDHDMIVKMTDYLNRCTNISQIGILCPSIKSTVNPFSVPHSEITYNKWVMQSGAMFHLGAFLKIGGFDENLFIDQVDYEYCVRLLIHNYKIIKVNRAILNHNIEDTEVKVKRTKGRTILINKYSSMRYYYILRNAMYCMNRYKTSYKEYYELQKRCISTYFLTMKYEKGKINKLRILCLAFIDYKIGAMGKAKHKF